MTLLKPLRKHKRDNNARSRLCTYCGEVFETFDKILNICGKCSGGLKMTRQGDEGKWSKICEQCERGYFTRNPNQRFCGTSCSKTYKKRESGETKPEDYMVSREIIFKRDGYKCIYCGKSSIEDGVKLHLEHIYPISEGGKEDLFNVATSCERCNIKKNTRILDEDIILRIWARNNELNKRFDEKRYDELVKVFKDNIELRLKSLA